MDTANVIGTYNDDLLFDARGEPLNEPYCQGAIPHEAAPPGIPLPQVDQSFSIKESESMVGKLAVMERLLEADRVCTIRESSRPRMPTIKEEQD